MRPQLIALTMLVAACQSDSPADTNDATSLATDASAASDSGDGPRDTTAPDAEVAPDPCPGGVARDVGPEGATLAGDGFTLTFPPEALASVTTICVRPRTDVSPPVGYLPYTPVFELSPDGLTLARPALLELSIAATAAAPAVFLSSAGPAFEWRGGVARDGTIAATIGHFSFAFAGDGVNFSDPPDTSCTRTRLVEARRLQASSALALFVQVDDCQGVPIGGLTDEDFELLEDGTALTSESDVATLPQRGAVVFVSLVFDVSRSIAARLPEVVQAAAALVDEIAERELPPVMFAIELLDGSAQNHVWLDYTSDLAAVRAALAGVPEHAPAEPDSTNLYGGAVDAVVRSQAAQRDLEQRQAGGSLSVGHVVLFTDGRDTASRLALDFALTSLRASTVELSAVGLESPDFDPVTLALLSDGRLFYAAEASALATAFGALANRIAGQYARSYLIGYCSPKRAGAHTVSVRVRSETATPANHTFDADGFEDGCSLATFTEACAGYECGGLACGVCDFGGCDGVLGTCVGPCSWSCTEPGATLDDGGTPVVCADECDSDGIAGTRDVCPFADDPLQRDTDGDGLGDACEDDPDGDRVTGAQDRCPTGVHGWVADLDDDGDRDGCRDSDEDSDDDNDGAPDADDACAKTPLGASDIDHDGCENVLDGDDDGDGLLDEVDPCPTFGLPPDLDGDGCPDSQDIDDDGDGRTTNDDDCPLGETGWVSDATTDHDHDGCRDDGEDLDDDSDNHPDVDDRCPRGAFSGYDSDGDGCINTEQPPAGQDFDGDGVLDVSDTCPAGDEGWVSSSATDFDGDGCRDAGEDADDDNDARPDTSDACARSVPPDYDSDGCEDAVDGDDDGDGRPDTLDGCRQGARFWTSSTSTDRDADGCKDSGEDLDDDGDGVLETNQADKCTSATSNTGWTSSPATDHDADGCRDDGEDTNDDNDSALDAADACPRGQIGWVASDATDLDRNGCRDGVDEADGDGDQIADARDGCPSNPTGWVATLASDYDLDGCRDDDDDGDDDGDGVPDVADGCPRGLKGWTSDVVSDPDGDGCAGTEDGDDDGDGVIDVADRCPTGSGWTSTAASDLDHDGCRDESEDDNDDGDGYVDALDACPRELGWHLGLANDDGDGCNDAVYQDADGDGVSADRCDGTSGAGCVCLPAVGYCPVAVVDILHSPVVPWVAALNRKGGACLMYDGAVRLFGADGAQVRVWPTAIVANTVRAFGGDAVTDCVFGTHVGVRRLEVFDDAGLKTVPLAGLDPVALVFTPSAQIRMLGLVSGYYYSAPVSGSVLGTTTLWDGDVVGIAAPTDGSECVASRLSGDATRVKCDSSGTASDWSADIACGAPRGLVHDGEQIYVPGALSTVQLERGTTTTSACVGAEPACSPDAPFSAAALVDARCLLIAKDDGLVACQAGHLRHDIPIVRGAASVRVLGMEQITRAVGGGQARVGTDVLVLSTLEGIETVSLVRYEPCQNVCEDGDLCTTDALVDGACVSTPVATPACGAP